MVDKIKLQAREQMARTGESYTSARRTVTGPGPGELSTTGRAAGWTWRQAADRLDVLAALARHAAQLREQLAALHAVRPPRALPGWDALLSSLGGTRFGAGAGGLVAAAGELVAAADPDALDRARLWHQRWFAEQAYALLQAAGDGRAPVEVPAPRPTDPTGWPEEWWTPDGARDVAARATSSTLSVAVLTALDAIDQAEMAAVELDDRRQEKIDQHLDDGCDPDDDGHCMHSTEPAEHEIEAWAQCEEAAAGYEPALAAFCEATRVLIRAHASTTG